MDDKGHSPEPNGKMDETHRSGNNPVLPCHKFSGSDREVTYFKGLDESLETKNIAESICNNIIPACLGLSSQFWIDIFCKSAFRNATLCGWPVEADPTCVSWFHTQTLPLYRLASIHGSVG